MRKTGKKPDAPKRMHNPFLIGTKIYLRAAEEGDERVIALSENHPEPRQTLFYALPTGLEKQREMLHRRMDDPNTVLFVIATIEPDQAIGTTSLVRIDWVGRMAVFYIAIAEKKNWSKGYGSEATRMMIDYAFGTLNLNRIQLHVSVENEAAVHSYKKAGFRIEGTLRQAMFHNNHYSDFYVMGLIKDEWEAL